MWGGTTLSYRQILINKCRRKAWNRKSSLEHQTNNCCRQDPPINVKISGQKLKRKQNVCVTSKYFPQNIY